VPAGNARGHLLSSWLNATSVAVGVLAVATTVYIAAVWLAADAARLGRRDLVEAFRVRALWAAIVAGGVACAALIVVRYDSQRLWDELTSAPAVGAVVLSAVAGAVAIGLVSSRRLEPARVVSVIAVAAVIAGWALAQNPYILPPVLTIDQAAACRATLIAVLVGLAIGSLILIPSLFVLYRMVLRGTFDQSPGESRLSAAPSPGGSDSGHATALCAVALATGVLVLLVGDAAWSIAIGVSLLLVAGTCGFFVVARSLASGELNP
jgi:cytochrome d ubiquinol oxidase subunit II